ncbi:MAG TPA: hypothetical protein ENG79_04845 [Desulfobacteraceae bacterium]|nr:hypothetical protein [Desulfobacteraceae bacterium]HDO30368.1 hypothetical protein [Desulfobacteraceae bacterium]
MRKLLGEISVIPGVTGSCIFDKTAGVLCTDLQTELPKDVTESVCMHFVRLLQMGRMNKLDIKSVHFRFDRYAVIGMNLDTGVILLTICDADANCSLVATTVAMLADDMRDELFEKFPPSPTPAMTIAKKEDIACLRPLVPDDERSGAEAMTLLLEEIEHALTAAIGPLSSMVMGGYLDKWRQNGPSSPGRLPELVTMLIREIEDPKLAEDFKSRIRHLL